MVKQKFREVLYTNVSIVIIHFPMTLMITSLIKNTAIQFTYSTRQKRTVISKIHEEGSFKDNGHHTLENISGSVSWMHDECGYSGHAYFTFYKYGI